MAGDTYPFADGYTAEPLNVNAVVMSQVAYNTSGGSTSASGSYANIVGVDIPAGTIQNRVFIMLDNKSYSRSYWGGDVGNGWSRLRVRTGGGTTIKTIDPASICHGMYAQSGNGPANRDYRFDTIWCYYEPTSSEKANGFVIWVQGEVYELNALTSRAVVGEVRVFGG